MKQKKSIKSKAKKFDKGKPNLTFIPYDAQVETAFVMEYGANKYGDSNYKQGHSYKRLLNATYRHLGQFLNGQDLDDESGLHHVAHAASNIVMLLWMIKNKPEMDDRDE